MEKTGLANGLSSEEIQKLLSRLVSEEKSLPTPYPGVARTGLYRCWKEEFGIHLEARVRPLLLKLVANYLDQGVAIWPFPKSDLGFYEAVRSLAEESFVPLGLLSDRVCRELLKLRPEIVLEKCLARLVEGPEWFEQYLLEVALTYPGWGGMVRQVEIKPTSLKNRRKIRLVEFLALELILEVGALSRELKGRFKPLKAKPGDTPYFSKKQLITESDRNLRVLLEAYEWSIYEPFLGAVSENSRKPEVRTIGGHRFQAIFCIDDREGSLRRYLETIDPTIETFGAPGFFGLDFAYQAAESTTPVQHCPIMLKPRHLVRAKSKIKNGSSLPQLSSLGHHSHTLFRGVLYTLFFGIKAGFELLLSTLRPTLGHSSATSFTWHLPDEELNIFRPEGSEIRLDGLYEGYTREELVQRVKNLLRSIGMTKDFSPIVIVVGHGSSSTNNPHFAAYDCGACSGRPGAPNARAFAMVANLPEIREGLSLVGISIPESTVFVGAIHDTTRDEILFFDEEKLPPSVRGFYEEFKRTSSQALKLNAQERCRKFEILEGPLTPEKAIREVRKRSAALFEPRPELNHATNMAALVGRRMLSRGIFMDRRVFLNSYNPFNDPEGNILANILGAVVPVCGGINLEYFFSRVDKDCYGAGTKLPHNVVSLLGVSNGVDSDLRTGLPTQMTEMHDPVRLMILVDQEPEIALRAVKKNPEVYEWVEKEWVYYASLSPSSGKLTKFERGALVPVELRLPGKKHPIFYPLPGRPC